MNCTGSSSTSASGSDGNGIGGSLIDEMVNR